MALRSFATVPNNKWVLKTLATKELKGFSSRFILFFDSAKGASSKKKPLGEGPFTFYKTEFILQLYDAYDFLRVLGDFVALVSYPDVESFLQHLLRRASEGAALRLVGCLLLGVFANIWPGAGANASGEVFVNISAAQALSAVEDLIVIHSREKGLFFLYRVVIIVHYFYSHFLFFCSFWPFFFHSSLVSFKEPRNYGQI